MQNPNERSILVVGNDVKVSANDIKNAFVKTFVDQALPTQAQYFENEKVELKYLNQTYSLSLGTTAGNEEHDRLRPLFYKKRDLIIVLFSVNDGWNRREPHLWLEEVKHFEPNTPVIMVGVGNVDTPKELKDQSYIQIPILDVNNVNYVFCTVFERLFNIKVERPVPEKYTKEDLAKLYTVSNSSSYLKLIPRALYNSFLDYATSKNHRHAKLTMFDHVINTDNQPPKTVTVSVPGKEKETCLIC